MSKVTQLTDPVTNEKVYPVTFTDNVYLPDGTSLTSFLNRIPLPVGSMVKSTCVQHNAGLHLADGSELAIGGSYDAFCQYVINHQEDFPITDLATYQSELTEYGQCGKYVITDTYVKLPRITKMTESANSRDELGQSVKAGLPNIKGSFVSMYTIAKDNNNDGVGAIETPYNTTSGYYGGSTSSSEWGYGFNFNANKSNDIYNDETTTVQPQTTKYYYYVVISNTVKTNIQVNIDNIATDLNNKADKSELNELKSLPLLFNTQTYAVATYNFLEDISNYRFMLVEFFQSPSNEYGTMLVPVTAFQRGDAWNFNSNDRDMSRYVILRYVSNTQFKITGVGYGTLTRIWGIK